jgi:hypothetical protein
MSQQNFLYCPTYFKSFLDIIQIDSSSVKPAPVLPFLKVSLALKTPARRGHRMPLSTDGSWDNPGPRAWLLEMLLA